MTECLLSQILWHMGFMFLEKSTDLAKTDIISALKWYGSSLEHAVPLSSVLKAPHFWKFAQSWSWTSRSKQFWQTLSFCFLFNPEKNCLHIRKDLSTFQWTQHLTTSVSSDDRCAYWSPTWERMSQTKTGGHFERVRQILWVSVSPFSLLINAVNFQTALENSMTSLSRLI